MRHETAQWWEWAGGEGTESACSGQRATWSRQRAADNMHQRWGGNGQSKKEEKKEEKKAEPLGTSKKVPPGAMYNLQPATDKMQQATCNVQPTMHARWSRKSICTAPQSRVRLAPHYRSGTTTGTPGTTVDGVRLDVPVARCMLHAAPRSAAGQEEVERLCGAHRLRHLSTATTRPPAVSCLR